MSKNKKTGKKQHAKSLGDVTLNDFANSTVCKTRLKKSSSNVTTIIKQLETDKAWYEKDDFEGDFDFVQEENEDGTVSVVIRKGPRHRVRSTRESCSEPNVEGNSYPLDIWFLISDYIRPEDVGRFAGICKASFAVVCTAKFWFSLYRRYYRSEPHLPERLQPECLLRLYGLRTSVIRSLHYMYPPFINRCISVTTSERHPDVLLKRQCVLMWYQQQSTWLYYFKLKEDTNITLPHLRRSETRQQPDLLEMLEDVSANPDENCRILRVRCAYFVAVPPVSGLTLTSVSLTLSHGVKYHRLQLGFGSGVYTTYPYNALGGSNNTTIILDPVINVKVLDWWHPHYPHNDGIEYLLNQE